MFDGCQYVTAFGDRAVRVARDGAQVDADAWSLPGPVSAMATDGAGTVLVLSGSTGQLVRTCAPAATAPVFDPAPSPVVEATSGAGAVVSFAVTASNENGPAEVICAPGSGSTFALGSTPVVCTASDAADPALSSTATFDVLVRDTTPPSLRLPAPVVTPAAGPQGTPVAFSVLAVDLVDPAPQVTCAPASGSVFPVGVTAVSCAATDASGNASPVGRFTVSVEAGAAAQLAQLIAQVDGMGLPRAVERVLLATLRLAAANVGSCPRSCDLMSVFTIEASVARLAGAMTAGQAAQFDAAAQRVRTALGCGRTCR